MLNTTCSLSAVGRQRVSSVLRDVFGSSFEVSNHVPQKEMDCSNAACDSLCACHAGIFVSQNTDDLFEVRFLGLTRNDCTFDAIGSVEGTNRDAVIRAALCAQKLLGQDQQVEELNQQLEYFVQQVSGDLEEACWFRAVADHVSACRADDPFEQLCERVLPELRSLLHAHSVFVLRAVDDTAISVLAMNADREEIETRQEAAVRLVQMHKDQADGNAFVWNHHFPVDESNQTMGEYPDWLDGFVLVKIGTGQQDFGWLLAMERQDAIGDTAQSRRSESEFGTHEATLMETTGVLLATHAANCELFEDQERTLVGVVTAMVNALDARDPYTHGHSLRVALISQRISEQLGLSEDEIEDIYLSGLLHDVGKIGVPDHVLLKNGPLDAEERHQIEQHTVIGNAILSPVKQLGKVLPGVMHHHEQMDGSGYPSRLKGNQIPIAGRIIAVADAYDAMTTSRPYRTAMALETAEQILLEGAGSHWDEQMVDAFFAVKAEVRMIYENQENNTANTAAPTLQYGRFEDVSQRSVVQLQTSGMKRS